MLTKMPKVGDVLIANENVRNHNEDVTVGKEYSIVKINEDGRARYLDDDGYLFPIEDGELGYFTLKSEAPTAEPVGYVEIDSKRGTGGDYVVYLTVDDAGYASLERLQSESTAQRKRTEIQSQIDALQAELNAL